MRGCARVRGSSKSKLSALMRKNIVGASKRGRAKFPA
jgi:hypothetical protein